MSTIIERVTQIVYEQLGIEKDLLTPEKDLYSDLGADSLDAVELVMAIEDEFTIELSDEEVENIKTIGEMVAMLEKRDDLS